MNCLILLATVLCMLPTFIQAQSPESVDCLATSTPVERRTLRASDDIAVGYTLASNPSECSGLPYVNAVNVTGFFPNYCGYPIPEEEQIYCSQPECLCRFDTTTSKYEVKLFDNAYPAASTLCLLTKPGSQYTGVREIDLAKCVAIVGTRTIWVQSTTPCRDLV